MKYYLLLFLLVIISCKNKQSDLPVVKQDQLKTYMVHKLREYDSTYSLDSFRFIRLDTLTQLRQYLSITSKILDDIDENKKMVDDYDEKYKKNIQIAKLYRGISSELFENYLNEAKENLSNAKKYSDANAILLKKVDSFQALFSKVDSVSPKYYNAVCLFQYRKPDQSIKRDTAYVVLNLNKDIIDQKEYTKYQ